MSVKQISVFVESKPGHLTRILELFESINVSVRGFSASDTGEYGIVRFILDDPDRALAALKDAGAACTSTDVLCMLLEDKPGELARVLHALALCGINVSYCYSMISTYIIVSTDDVDAAQAALAGQPVRLINQEDLAPSSGTSSK